MRKYLYGFAILAVAFACKPAQPVVGTTKVISVNTISTEKTDTRKMLYTLANDSLAGRKPGTAGMEKASVFVENYFKAAGIVPYFGSSYRDTLKVNKAEAYNLVGLIGNRNHTKPYVVLGAHLDHIGTHKSGTDTVYNGANDNASGVTAVLQLAARLTKEVLPYNILVVLFTGEEDGLLGSKHLANKLKQENTDVKYMLNFEMVGVPMAGQPNNVYITGFKQSDLAKVLNKAAAMEWVVYLPDELKYQLFKRSDNYPFYQALNIPAHTISTFDFKNYAYYHQLADEAEQLDIAHMENIIDLSYKAILKMMQDQTVPEL